MGCANLTAAVSVVSFAIQHLLQFLDPFISRLPGLNSDAEADAAAVARVANTKKAVMGFLSFLLGLIAVNVVSGLQVLKCAGFDAPILDPIVSALVMGAGTETLNTVQKLMSYAKDKTKPA